MVQYCPAPVIAGILGVTAAEALVAGTAVTGSAIAAGGAVGAAALSHKKRDVYGKRDLPAGVSQESANLCLSSLAGVTVVFTPQENNGEPHNFCVYFKVELVVLTILE